MFSLVKQVLCLIILNSLNSKDVLMKQLVVNESELSYSRNGENIYKASFGYRYIKVLHDSSEISRSERGFDDQIVGRLKRATNSTLIAVAFSIKNSTNLKFNEDKQDLNKAFVNVSTYLDLTHQETSTEVFKAERVSSVINTGLISKTTYDQWEEVVRYMTYFTQIVAVVFVSFNIIVYTRNNMRSPTSSYLIAVNITQLLTIISGSFLTIAGFIFGDKAFATYSYLFIGLYISNYFTVSTRRCTFVLTCLVAAERFLAVAFPLKSKHIKLVRKPILFIVSTVVISFIFHLFSVLKYDIIPLQDGYSNETLWRFRYTNFFLENKSNMVSWSIASKIIFVYIQLIGCLILNVGIVIALRRHRISRLRLASSEDVSKVAQEKQTTITILVSTFVFVLLALPVNTSSVVANLDSTNYGINTKNHYLFYILLHLGGWFELLSDCTNFMFYIALSSRFRKTFIQVVCKCFSTSSEETELNDSKNTSQYRLSAVSQSC